MIYPILAVAIAFGFLQSYARRHRDEIVLCSNREDSTTIAPGQVKAIFVNPPICNDYPTVIGGGMPLLVRYK